MSEYYFFISAI